MAYHLNYGSNQEEATLLAFAEGEDNDAIVRFAEAVTRLEADEAQYFAYASLTHNGITVLGWSKVSNERAVAVGTPVETADA